MQFLYLSGIIMPYFSRMPEVDDKENKKARHDPLMPQTISSIIKAAMKFSTLNPKDALVTNQNNSTIATQPQTI